MAWRGGVMANGWRAGVVGDERRRTSTWKVRVISDVDERGWAQSINGRRRRGIIVRCAHMRASQSDINISICSSYALWRGDDSIAANQAAAS